MVGSEVFLIKPKHQYHLFQWGEYIYGAQSWKEKRLLHESMFNPSWQMKFDSKLVGSEVFLMKSKHQFIYPNNENVFMVPNHEKKGD